MSALTERFRIHIFHKLKLIKHCTALHRQATSLITKFTYIIGYKLGVASRWTSWRGQKMYIMEDWSCHLVIREN
jgi:hypothetical protein